MFIKFYILAFCVLTTLFVGGCSMFTGDHGVFRGRSKDYLNSGSIEPITLPQGMSSVRLEQVFVIPDVDGSDEFGDTVIPDDYETPRPDPLASDKSRAGVKIQKLAGQRWIFLHASPSQVWPRTQNFLSEYNLRVTASSAKDGLIETDWLAFKDDSRTRSKYRIMLEKGMHPGTTEVHVLQVQAPAQGAPRTVSWPDKSHDPKREAWLLDELAAVLAENVDNNSASLLGQNVGGKLKVEFVRGASEPTMKLELPYVRAWATISHSLQQEGFVLWEKNSEIGVLYAGLGAFKAGGCGFWCHAAFWRDNKPAPKTAQYSLPEILSHLSPESDVKDMFSSIDGVKYGDELEKARGYLVVLTPTNERSIRVNVRDYRGRKLGSQQTKDILRLIRKNLI